MLRKNSGHQSKGVGHSEVRSVYSTQLDVDQLERDLLSRDQPHRNIGDGDVIGTEGQQPNLFSFDLAARSPGYYNGRLRSRPSLISLPGEEAAHKTVLRVVPVTHNANGNAGPAALDVRSCCKRLNRDNNARVARSVAGKRTTAGRPPGRRGNKGDHVIKLPPNSIIKISSKSALNIRKQNQQGAKAAKSRSQSRKPPSNKAKNPEASKVVKSVTSVASRRSNHGGSSRYRVTPSLTGTSGNSIFSRASSLISYSRMGRRPASAASVAGRRSYRSSAGSGSTADRSTPGKGFRSKRRRQQSMPMDERGVFTRPGRRCYRSMSCVREDVPSRMALRRGARKLSKTSVRPRGRPRKISVSGRTSARGRPSKSRHGRRGRSSRSRSSFTDNSSKAPEAKRGLFDRMSSFWRSYSSSRGTSPAGAATPSRENHDSSSTCSSRSWMSRLLPLARDTKSVKRLRRGRDASGAGDSRRQRDDGRSSSKRGKASSRGFCSIM